MTEFLLGCGNGIKVRESGQREFSESASSIVARRAGRLATVILLGRPTRGRFAETTGRLTHDDGER